MTRRNLSNVLLGVAVAGAIAAAHAGSSAESAAAGGARMAAGRGYDFSTLTRGAQLYRRYCAACHGPQAEGAPNWQIKGPDGKYPPPPLNGTAHAWHHPYDVLKRTIKKGTIALGGSMPAWGEKMSDEEIDAVIAWIVSQWPEEIYVRWRRGGGHH